MDNTAVYIALAKAPCKDCPIRAIPPAPDCHNDSCPAWAEFRRRSELARRRRELDRLADGALAIGRINRKDQFIKSDDR